MTVNKRSALFFAFAYFCGSCTGLRYELAGYRFFPYVYGWMSHVTEPSDWFTARINCHMQGAFLVSPWSEEFVSHVGKLRINAEPIYSGVHSTYAEGAFLFEDGKPGISLNPQDLAPLDRCGVFFANGTTGLLPCDLKLSYVCYAPEIDIKPPATEPALSQTLETNCGDKSLGYEFSEKTGRCYKFHAHAAHTWDDAKSTCSEEDAQLAIINSNEEAQVLTALFKRYPRSKLFGASYATIAGVGVYKSKNHFYWINEWRTIEDNTLEEARYASWAPKPPHPLATYGYITRDGLLYDDDPAIRDIPFICEKSPSMKLNDIPSSTPEPVTEETTEISVSSTPEFCGTPVRNEVKTTEPSTETKIETSNVTVTPAKNQTDIETELGITTKNEINKESAAEIELDTELDFEPTLLKTPICGDETLGYRYHEKLGNCYKFIRPSVMDIFDANSRCTYEDAFNAVFETKEEANTVANIFKRYSAKNMANIQDSVAYAYYNYSIKEQLNLKPAADPYTKPYEDMFSKKPLIKSLLINKDGSLSEFNITQDYSKCVIICQKHKID